MDRDDGEGRAIDREDRVGTKRDRLARLGRVIAVLKAHPDGIHPGDLARRTDTSVRTVYRDLKAIESELEIAVWSEGGKWGVASDEFLPPLKLTLNEAMAVVLSARLMVRFRTPGVSTVSNGLRNNVSFMFPRQPANRYRPRDQDNAMIARVISGMFGGLWMAAPRAKREIGHLAILDLPLFRSRFVHGAAP